MSYSPDTWTFEKSYWKHDKMDRGEWKDSGANLVQTMMFIRTAMLGPDGDGKSTQQLRRDPGSGREWYSGFNLPSTLYRENIDNAITMYIGHCAKFDAGEVEDEFAFSQLLVAKIHIPHTQEDLDKFDTINCEELHPLQDPMTGRVLAEPSKKDSSVLFYMLAFASPNGVNSRHVAASMDKDINEFEIQLSDMGGRLNMDLLVRIIPKAVGYNDAAWAKMERIREKCKSRLEEKRKSKNEEESDGRVAPRTTSRSATVSWRSIFRMVGMGGKKSR